MFIRVYCGGFILPFGVKKIHSSEALRLVVVVAGLPTLPMVCPNWPGSGDSFLAGYGCCLGQGSVAAAAAAAGVQFISSF